MELVLKWIRQGAKNPDFARVPFRQFCIIPDKAGSQVHTGNNLPPARGK